MIFFFKMREIVVYEYVTSRSNWFQAHLFPRLREMGSKWVSDSLFRNVGLLGYICPLYFSKVPKGIKFSIQLFHGCFPSSNCNINIVPATGMFLVIGWNLLLLV